MALAIFAATPVKAETENISINRSFALLLEADKSSHSLSERIRIMREVYDVCFSKIHNRDKLREITDDQLKLVFRAAFILEFYTADQRYLRDMQLSLAELERRALTEDKQYVDLYGALIHERDFSAARLLRERHYFLQAEVLPEFRETSGFMENSSTALFIDPNQNQLTRDAINLRVPALVVVVAHPLCHFCQYAIRDIGADQELRDIFISHAIWLSPTEVKLYFPVFQKWNKAHPDFPMVLAFNQREWPMIDTWNTPTFYFFKQGEVVAKLSGWPEEGRKKELLEGLRRIDLVE